MKSINQNDYLTVGGVYDFPRHALLHTAAGKNGCCVEISSKERTDITYIDKRQEGMLVLSPCKLKIESGDIQISTLDFTRLAKLQVFIDKAQQRKKEISHDVFWGYLPTSLGHNPTSRDLEYWFINQSILNENNIDSFSAVLKNNEWYDLVDFLLDESGDGNNHRMQVLCTRYGLSVSHFRRLARHALGNTAKVELRDWRLVRALLELVESDNNLTTIAMNHGYASLSHFSNEVKDTFGVSPRSLKNILHTS